MPFPLEDKCVIAVASSALFDLSISDAVFREQGETAYRTFQHDHEREHLRPGVALPLVKRLLALNSTDSSDQPVEVVLLSRNDPDTGLRVVRSIESFGLPITRAAFVKGRTPFRYLEAFNASLFLSANEQDVRTAVARGAPAGRVLPTDFIDDSAESELRVAFDFDGIVADDSAEAIFKSSGLKAFHAAETAAASVPLPAGPLAKFFREVARLQERERQRKLADESYAPRLHLAIITARNAPALERVVTTLRAWGIEVDEVFFLGAIEKARILKEFRPHIFFDDQLSHLTGEARLFPCVHVPFGVANVPTANDSMSEALDDSRRTRNAPPRPPSNPE